jgi:uncharacterized protein with NRDE domain
VCLVVVALGVSKEIPFALAANRDELFARGTAPASWWSHEGVELFGGRDVEKGGTWLGLTRRGRIALVTNVRDPSLHQVGASRGWLVRDALVSARLPPVFSYDELPAYNVLVGQGDELWYLRDGADAQRVTTGFHGLSNHRLDTKWPKVEASVRAMESARLEDKEVLFRILADDVPASDDALPKTGVPLEVERALSPPFVRLPAIGYGTRCSTVVIRHADGHVDYEERTFDERGEVVGTVRETLR